VQCMPASAVAAAQRKSNIVDRKQTAVFSNCKAVCHAGNVVGHGSLGIRFRRHMILGRQQAGLGSKRVKQIADDALRLIGHPHNLVMLVQMQPQKLFERLLLILHRRAESDERRRFTDGCNIPRRIFNNVLGGLPGKIDDERADHAPHGFVHQPAIIDFWVFAHHSAHMLGKKTDSRKLFYRNQSGTQAVIHVMIIVCDLISEIGNLRFKRRALPLDESFANFSEQARIFQGTVFKNSLAGFEAQIESVEGGVTLFEQIHDPQRLQVVLKTAIRCHAFVKGVLAGVTKRCMTEIMCERDGFHQIFIKLQIACNSTRDLGNFETVRQPGPEEIAFMVNKNLGFVFETTKSGGMNYAVPITLEFAPAGGRRFATLAPAGVMRANRIGGKLNHVKASR
jgi:hypothetical protein